MGVRDQWNAQSEHICVRAIRQGLADLGYTEGRTHVLDLRWTEGRPEQEAFPVLGAELVKAGANVLVSVASGGLKQSRAALVSVPVVVATGYFPVEIGLVASLARPGGNITGMALFTADLFAKRVQLLAEAVPNLKRIAAFPQQPDAELAVRAFGIDRSSPTWPCRIDCPALRANLEPPRRGC
jgi:putative ABC transport system substrate-binding protein